MDRKKPQAEVFFYILCLQLKTTWFKVVVKSRGNTQNTKEIKHGEQKINS